MSAPTCETVFIRAPHATIGEVCERPGAWRLENGPVVCAACFLRLARDPNGARHQWILGAVYLGGDMVVESAELTARFSFIHSAPTCDGSADMAYKTSPGGIHLWVTCSNPVCVPVVLMADQADQPAEP